MRCCGGASRLSRIGEARLLSVHVLLLVASLFVDTVATSTLSSSSGVAPPPWIRLPFMQRTKGSRTTVTNPLDAVRTAASDAAAIMTQTATVRPTAAVVGLGAMVAAGVALPAWFSGGGACSSGSGSSTGSSKSRSRDASVNPVTVASAPRGLSKSDGALVPSLVVSTALETVGLWSILVAAHAMSERVSLPLVSRVIFKGLPVIQWAALGLVIFGSSAVKSTIATVWHTAMNVVSGRKRSSHTSSGASLASTAQVLRPTVVPSGCGEWYDSLEKPWFNPPAWLFPIMWLVVCKPTQVYAVSRLLIWVPTPWWILGLYCLHLALGDAWNDIFFGQQRIRLGANVMVWFGTALLVPTVLLVLLTDHGGSSVEATTAARFLWPTLVWVAVATALNFEIRRLNPTQK